MDFMTIAACLTPKQISPNKLYLDPNNPRLKGETDYTVPEGANPLDPKVQLKILNYLLKNHKYDVNELKSSILNVGFFKMDRIVIVKISDSNDSYLVLEGNRRIAAIKSILLDEEERNIQVKDFVKKSLEKLDVLELKGDNLDDLSIKKATWFLQGLRHVSGIKAWGPYQQAELIKQFVASGVGFTTAGQAVGLGRRRAGMMWRAYNALEQMKADEEFCDHAKPDLFSHFEQTIAQPIIKSWLDWDEANERFTNINALKRFYELITPNEEKGSIAKAVDIREKLPKIIESKTALEYLMKGEDIEFCYSVAISDKASAPTWHAAAKDAIRKIQSIPWSYKFNGKDLKLLEDLIQTSSSLLQRAKESAQ